MRWILEICKDTRKVRVEVSIATSELSNNHLGHNDSSFIAETSFVHAPLNSRVFSSSNAPKSKGKAKQESLERIPLEIQEALILEDLLFVLTVREI